MKEALKSVSKFVKENSDLNIVLIDSPHRYDMIPESCVNLEVIKFNRQVRKIMKLHSNVKILDLELERNSFTTHGLHLNNKGKKLVSQNLARLIQQSLSDAQTHSAIPIQWGAPPKSTYEPEPQDLTITEETSDIISTGPVSLDGKINEDQNNLDHTSYPRRNRPAKKNPDFLWT